MSSLSILLEIVTLTMYAALSQHHASLAFTRWYHVIPFSS